MPAGRQAHRPRFKKKGHCRDAFYVANDRFRIEGTTAVLPKIGSALLRERLRWPGRIMGASVGRHADHWYLVVQVDVPDHVARLRRIGNSVIGVDLGVSTAATLSSGEKFAAPRPLAAALRHLRIRTRRHSRKLEAAKVAAGIKGPIPKGMRLPMSTDVGFYEFRRQLQYKAERYGTQLVLADRWYPSSKLCSACGDRYAALGLCERTWTCAECGAHHDRDVNAAINLQRLATGARAAQPALPVASPTATSGTAAGDEPAGGGKVTPARHEHGQQDGSGQEENGAHMCARLQ